MSHLLTFSRRRLTTAAIGTVLLASATLPLHAQSLGDLAKKEQERRKTVPPAGKVYSNKDLPTPPAPAPSPAAGALPPATTAEAKPDAAKPAAKDEKDEAWWRDRVVQAR